MKKSKHINTGAVSEGKAVLPKCRIERETRGFGGRCHGKDKKSDMVSEG